jgi:serine acetyltransferase
MNQGLQNSLETASKEDVWIASGATVLDGCTIGKSSVIAAGAVVTKSFPPYSVIAGFPGKLAYEVKNRLIYIILTLRFVLYRFLLHLTE